MVSICNNEPKLPASTDPSTLFETVVSAGDNDLAANGLDLNTPTDPTLTQKVHEKLPSSPSIPQQ
jgi:hypothetical protein